MNLEATIYLLDAVLIAGNIFAWYQFYKVIKNSCDTCSVDLHKSPFKSKCFWGAIFFSIALALSLYATILL
ncbi:hypothetical protein KJ766_01840 [Patescibacteria group bacterium]|nr:hypothetical protein [Patescibacteria group bacterium]